MANDSGGSGQTDHAVAFRGLADPSFERNTGKQKQMDLIGFGPFPLLFFLFPSPSLLN